MIGSVSQSIDQGAFLAAQAWLSDTVPNGEERGVLEARRDQRPFLTLHGELGCIEAAHFAVSAGEVADGLAVLPPLPKRRSGPHRVYNFTVEGHHTYIADGYRVHNISVGTFGPATSTGLVTSQIGAAIAGFFAPDDIALSLLTMTAGDVIGGYIGDLYVGLAGGVDTDGVPLDIAEQLFHSPARFGASILRSAVGVGGSILAEELLQLTGIDHPAAQMLARATGGMVARYGAAYMTQALFDNPGVSASTREIFSQLFNWGSIQGAPPPAPVVPGAPTPPPNISPFALGVGGTFGSIAGTYTGTTLANMLFDGTTMSQQLGGAIGSAVAGLGASLASQWAVAGIMSALSIGTGPAAFLFFFASTFAGSFLGSAIGRLFGSTSIPKPRAWGTLAEDPGTNEFEIVGYATEDGGSLDVAKAMSQHARELLNATSQSVGGWLHSAMDVDYGHYQDGSGNKYFWRNSNYVSFDAAFKHADWKVAVERGVVEQIQSAKYYGGDAYVLKAIKWRNSVSADDGVTLKTLEHDIFNAQVYGQYQDNRALWQKMIEEAGVPTGDAEADNYNQEVIQQWIDTELLAQHANLGSVTSTDQLAVGNGSPFRNTIAVDHPDAVVQSSGQQTLSGNFGIDLLVGGSGQDVLKGGGGDDIYRFNQGDGRDTIIERNNELQYRTTIVDIAVEVDTGDNRHLKNIDVGVSEPFTAVFEAGTDTIEFGEGITPDHLVFEFQGSDLIIGIKESPTSTTPIANLHDKILIDSYAHNSFYGVEVLSFAGGAKRWLRRTTGPGGVSVDMRQFSRTLEGTNGAETLRDNERESTLIGGAGNDRLEGGRGDDTYFFGRGDGSDVVYDDVRFHRSYSSVHSTTLEVTSGTYGGETVTEVVCNGGEPCTTYTYGGDRGDAYTYVESFVTHAWGWDVELDGGRDVLQFGEGITLDQVKLVRPTEYNGNIENPSDDLIVHVLTAAELEQFDQGNLDLATRSGGDRVRIEGWFDLDNRIELFQFADGRNYVVSRDEGRGGYGLAYRDSVGDAQDLPSAPAPFQDISTSILAFDIANDGLHTIKQQASAALFDMDNDGYREATAWVGPSDGVLVYDRNNNGLVDGLFELFSTDGSAITSIGALNESSGPAHVSVLDAKWGNGAKNGIVDHNDEAWQKLRIWTDINGDGTVQIGEWHQLHRFGITGFEALPPGETYRGPREDNGARAVGYYTQLDSERPLLGRLFDVELLYDTQGMRLEQATDGSGQVRVVYEGAANASSVINVAGQSNLTVDPSLSSVVTGTTEADVMRVAAGSATETRGVLLNGGSGNDTLFGGRNGDVLIGGSGRDRMLGDGGDDIVVADADDFDRSATGSDTLIFDDPAGQRIAGGSGQDFLVLEVEENVHFGNFGDMEFEGILTGAGDDSIEFSRSDGSALESGLLAAAGSGDDWIRGNSSASAVDNLSGGSGDDTIFSRGGLDQLNGEAGDDVLLAGADVGVLFNGGLGVDYIGVRWRAGAQTIDLSAGTHGSGSAVDRFVSIEGIRGSELNDTLTGDSGDNYFEGQSGEDRLIGGSGRDWALYHRTSDKVVADLSAREADISRAPSGAAAYIETDSFASIENLRGGGGDDTLRGNSVANTLVGGSGADRLVGRDGFDSAGYLWAKSGVEASLKTNSGAKGEAAGDTFIGIEALIGSDHADTFEGGAIGAKLFGKDGNDTLTPGSSGNILHGGQGNDRLFVYSLVNTFYGGDGFDTLDYTNRGGWRAVVDLNDTLDEDGNSYSGVEAVVGTPNIDTLSGDKYDNALFGQGGVDTLEGRGGNDTLDGGGGRDTLFGGAGHDTLDGNVMAGGAGNDIFVFNQGSGNATILTDGGGSLYGEDTISFGTGIALSDLTFDIYSGPDLTISVDNGGYSSTLMIDEAGVNAAAIPHKMIFKNGEELALYNIWPQYQHIPIGSAGNDNLWVDHYVENEFFVGSMGNDTIHTSHGTDFAFGGSGRDLLYGDLGTNQLNGGSGQDTYVLRAAHNNIVETADGGRDTVFAVDVHSVSLATHVEDLLVGSNWRVGADGAVDPIVHWFGNAQDNHIVSGGFANTIWARGGADTVESSDGDDFVAGGAGDDTVNGGVNNDRLYGQHGDDLLQGGAWNDVLDGGTGQDFLAGNHGVDHLSGGSGDDSLFGGTSIDYLFGGRGNDFLNGGDGADTMEGGRHNDTYKLDGADDVVVEEQGAGGDTIIAPFEVTLSDYSHVEHLLLQTGSAAVTGVGSSGGNSIIGNSLNNSLIGLSGDDVLDGGLGADTLEGGSGHDTYRIDNAGDRITEALGGGVDKLITPFGGNLKGAFSRIEDIELLTGSSATFAGGNSAANSIVGNSGTDTLRGFSGHDVLDGGSGADTMEGGSNNDTYRVDTKFDVIVDSGGQEDRVIVSLAFTAGEGISAADATVYAMTAGIEEAVLVGNGPIRVDGNAADNWMIGHDHWSSLFGKSGDDSLVGNDGEDYLDGGSGADTLVGGLDSDTFVVDELGDVVVEAAGQGAQDKVRSRIDYTLGSAVENLALIGSAVVDGVGNNLDNTLSGNDAVNTLRGLVGKDSLFGGSGSDRLFSHEGDDLLDGGSGADEMLGGTGSDTFYVDHAGDSVIDYVDVDGTLVNVGSADHVIASVDYSLSTFVEILSLVGDVAVVGQGGRKADTLFGNANGNTLLGFFGVDTLFGGAGDDVLDGEASRDTAFGGLGNDTFLFNSLFTTVVDGATLVAGDTAIEFAGGGDDLVVIDLANPVTAGETLSIVLADNIETLEIGANGRIDATGNRSDNRIVGNSGVNSLNGASGDDHLFGADGPDQLRGGSGQDTIDAGNGDDDVFGHDGVDTLHGRSGNDTIRGGTNSDRLTGGSGSDSLIGGLHKDKLFGGLGDDKLDGGSGNDTLTADGGLNQLFGDSGSDTIYGGLDKDSLFGGNGEDRLQGRNGNDFIEGGSDADRLFGGQGDDTLSGGSGIDRITGGSGTDTLHGHDGDDLIYGVSGANALLGMAGDDSLVGGVDDDFLSGAAGNDTLFGGSGDDIFVMKPGGGEDVIMNDGGSGTDVLRFASSGANQLNADDLWFSRNGDDLEIALLGASGRVTLNQWYTGGAGIESFEVVVAGVPGTQVLDKADVASLVSVMASYALSAGDAIGYADNLPQAVQNQVNTLWAGP
ncbi:MAG: hypothetical protein Kilf2KO_24320 [Rhodospirillales bacterium]